MRGYIVAEKQLFIKKSGVAPVGVQKQRHIKIRIPIALRMILPIAATIIMFQGCAGSSQAQTERKGGDSVLVFQTSKQVSKTEDATAKVSVQDTLKLTPVKTGKGTTNKELDSLKADIDKRNNALTTKMLDAQSKNTIFSPLGDKYPPLNKDDMRKHLILSDFGAVIDALKNNDVAKAKKCLADAEKRMTDEEKKTDNIYLQLKELIYEEPGKIASQQVRLTKGELDSLEAEIKVRDRILTDKITKTIDNGTIFSPVPGKEKHGTPDQEDTRKSFVLNDLRLALEKIRLGDFEGARGDLKRAETKMTAEERKTDEVYIKLKKAVND